VGFLGDGSTADTFRRSKDLVVRLGISISTFIDIIRVWSINAHVTLVLMPTTPQVRFAANPKPRPAHARCSFGESHPVSAALVAEPTLHTWTLQHY
jgi:hypothetical protein